MYIEHSDNPCIQNTLIVYLVSHYHCQLFQEKHKDKKTDKFVLIALEEGNLPPKNMQKSYYFGESFMTINKAFQKGLTTMMWENRPVLFLQCAICIYRYISIGKSWDS